MKKSQSKMDDVIKIDEEEEREGEEEEEEDQH